MCAYLRAARDQQLDRLAAGLDRVQEVAVAIGDETDLQTVRYLTKYQHKSVSNAGEYIPHAPGHGQCTDRE